MPPKLRASVAMACIALVGLVHFSPPALADDRPDFSGAWTLDSRASDPVEELLKAVGRSWLERKAASSARVTQRIVQTDDALTIEVDSTLRSTTEVLRTDGSIRTLTNEKGNQVSSRTFWSEDGAALITSTDAVLANGDRGRFVITRTIEDGGRTLRQRLELHMPDGRVLAADRILRRI